MTAAPVLPGNPASTASSSASSAPASEGPSVLWEQREALEAAWLARVDPEHLTRALTLVEAAAATGDLALLEACVVLAAHILARDSDVAGAAALLRRHVRAAPGEADARSKLPTIRFVLAFYEALGDGRLHTFESAEQLRAVLLLPDLPAPSRCWGLDALATIAFRRGAYLEAADLYRRTLTAAHFGGLRPRAVYAALNLSTCAANLERHDAALNWARVAAAAVRGRGWTPVEVAVRIKLSSAHRRLGRLTAARRHGEAALTSPALTSPTRNRSIALINAGEVHLASKDGHAAAGAFVAARAIAERRGFADLVLEATRGLAEAALLQGLLDEAGRLAAQALEHAEREASTARRAECLITMAQVQRQARTLAEDGLPACVHTLDRAREQLASVESSLLPDRVLRMLAEAFEHAGAAAKARHLREQLSVRVAQREAAECDDPNDVRGLFVGRELARQARTFLR